MHAWFVILVIFPSCICKGSSFVDWLVTTKHQIKHVHFSRMQNRLGHVLCMNISPCQVLMKKYYRKGNSPSQLPEQCVHRMCGFLFV